VLDLYDSAMAVIEEVTRILRADKLNEVLENAIEEFRQEEGDEKERLHNEVEELKGQCREDVTRQ